jgi:hypothetical protein
LLTNENGYNKTKRDLAPLRGGGGTKGRNFKLFSFASWLIEEEEE